MGGFSQKISDYDLDGKDGNEEMVMSAQAGDLIIHHSMLIHRAPANRSHSRSRRAVGAIFYGESAKLDQEKYDQRQLEIKQRQAQLQGQTECSVGLASNKKRKLE